MVGDFFQQLESESSEGLIKCLANREPVGGALGRAVGEGNRGLPCWKSTQPHYQLITCHGRDTGNAPVNGSGIEWLGPWI